MMHLYSRSPIAHQYLILKEQENPVMISPKIILNCKGYITLLSWCFVQNKEVDILY